MRRKGFLKQKAAMFAAGLLAVASLQMLPSIKAEAAITSASFKQQIKVEDVTDHLHESGIRFPNLTFTYFLDPVVDDALLPDNTHYETIKGNFPDTTTPASQYKGIVHDYSLHASDAFVTSGDGGLFTMDVPLFDTSSATDIFDPTAVTGAWGANKIYRYALTIQNVCVGTAAGGADVRTAGNGLFAGGDATLYVDVDIDRSGAIRTIVIHEDPTSSEESDKVEGFVYASDLALQYNTYDIVVTSTYAGNENNYDAAQVIYTVNLANLPTYLDQATLFTILSSGTSSNEYVGENRQNWSQLTPASANVDEAQFSGTLQSGWHITIPGLPIAGASGDPVTFNSEINYANVSATPDDFNQTLFMGANVEPLSGDITTLELFRASPFAATYSNSSINTTAHTMALTTPSTMVASASPDANNVRFAIFDPDQLILVGVVVRAIPGIILVGAAAVGGALLLRKRRAED